jgi:hypothetical protein
MKPGRFMAHPRKADQTSRLAVPNRTRAAAARRATGNRFGLAADPKGPHSDNPVRRPLGSVRTSRRPAQRFLAGWVTRGKRRRPIDSQRRRFLTTALIRGPAAEPDRGNRRAARLELLPSGNAPHVGHERACHPRATSRRSGRSCLTHVMGPPSPARRRSVSALETRKTNGEDSASTSGASRRQRPEPRVRRPPRPPSAV